MGSVEAVRVMAGAVKEATVTAVTAEVVEAKTKTVDGVNLFGDQCDFRIRISNGMTFV